MYPGLSSEIKMIIKIQLPYREWFIHPTYIQVPKTLPQVSHLMSITILFQTIVTLGKHETKAKYMKLFKSKLHR